MQRCPTRAFTQVCFSHLQQDVLVYLFLGPAFATNEESLSSQAPKTVSFERWGPQSSSGSTGAASCLKAVTDWHARMQVFPLAVPTDTHPRAVIAVPRLLFGTACVPACSLRVLHTLHFQPAALLSNSKTGSRLLCLNMRAIPLASLAVVAYPAHGQCTLFVARRLRLHLGF